MTIACVFPGQGSQVPGMGKDFYDTFQEAREVFQEVDEALGQKLSDIIFHGTQEELTLTTNTQPALMSVSMAIVRVMEKHLGRPLYSGVTCMAGHSLGEYSAFCAAHAFDLTTTAKLLRTRGLAMQDAVGVGIGAMAAILGLEAHEVEKITSQVSTPSSLCCLANDNSPGQVVISGHKMAVEHAIALANESGAKKSLLLPVSAPFHCPLMASAGEKMQEALSHVAVKAPKTQVISNVTAKEVKGKNDIPFLLVQQVTGRVRWRESVERMMAKGIKTMVEIGAGKVLTGLGKRITHEDIECITLSSLQGLEPVLKSF